MKKNFENHWSNLSWRKVKCKCNFFWTLTGKDANAWEACASQNL